MTQMDLFTVSAIGAFILLLIHYVRKKHEYFLTKPVPCVKPSSFLLGSIAPLLFRKMDIASFLATLYKTFPGSKIIGFYDFLLPTYLICDADVIKQIAVKDFDHFMNHTASPSSEQNDDRDSLFQNTLFALRGQKWKDMRVTLSPAFTGSKMRLMFELVRDCGKSMAAFVKAESVAGKRLQYEMKDIFTRYANDVIATVAFGIEVDSLRHPDNDFYTRCKKMINFQRLSVVCKIFLLRSVPSLAQKLKLQLADAEAAEYFKAVITDNMRQREANSIMRNDMIHMLMEVRKGALKHQMGEHQMKDAGFATAEESVLEDITRSRVWSENELLAQCFMFFLAGFETVSSCLSFTTYELAINPKIQHRMFEEVQETERTLKGSQLTYEVLQKMEYMDMVVSEALRLRPPVSISKRVCNKDYLYDVGDGTSFIIEKGHVLWIPMISVLRDPKYFPNPEKFDPERFGKDNRANIHTGAYLPFGIGPRNCIGSRLALMEVKCILYFLLKDFSIEPYEKTQIPLQMAKSLFTVGAEKGIWLEFKPRVL
ncbi:probable cytochrome P450 9f2 [Toxorhynchites rutilus septentrionalis]|uniref:probable cytochrome P450 9f2 n=1 Tax=Toxorhynchites rutilus septentrionalis TaxID=329112 RepID=UPI002479F44C|nr:probable cytochrome P450 9f2 [Toxorhynchites rutilus septentrionalis]